MTNLNKLFVIVDFDARDDETSEPLFWSNKDGWVSLNTESVLVERKHKGNLPMGGEVKLISLSDAITLVNGFHEAAGSGDPEGVAEMESVIRDGLDGDGVDA